MWASEERQLVADKNRYQRISVCGKQFQADKTGALYWPAERALIVADMHLEKASSFALRGQMLPPYDTQTTLFRLAEVVDAYETETIIALGDSFHDISAPTRMSADNREILSAITQNRSMYWLVGNHDHELPSHLGGHVLNELKISGLTFRHEPFPGPITHEIAGHLHPAARFSNHGATIRRPCFFSNGRRLILPAFGALTGGLNVLDDAFKPLFNNDGFNVWLLGEEGLYPVPPRLLRED